MEQTKTTQSINAENHHQLKTKIKSINKISPLLAPKKRVQTIDFARGLALIFVVVIHILDNLSSPEVQQTVFAYATYVFGRLTGAVVFMFLMGVSLSFSKKADFKQGLIRAFELLGIAYALNILRGTVPVWFGLTFNFLTEESVGYFTPLVLLQEVDILQFAGLALVCLAFLRLIGHNPILWILTGFAILGITPLVTGRMSEIPLLNILLNSLWGTEEHVYFSLFPWLVYPLAGMVYGFYFKKSENKPRFFAQSAFIGFLIAAVGTPFLFTNHRFDDLNLHETFFLFRNTSTGAIWNIGFVCLWLSLCYWLIESRSSHFMFKRLFAWSKSVTSFYVIQWILIGWLSIFVSDVSLGSTIFCMILLLFLTDRLTLGWTRFRSKRNTND